MRVASGSTKPGERIRPQTHQRIAMPAMRHSRIELAMNYDTDPTLLDVAGAVNALPAFGAAGTDVRR